MALWGFSGGVHDAPGLVTLFSVMVVNNWFVIAGGFMAATSAPSPNPSRPVRRSQKAGKSLFDFGESLAKSAFLDFLGCEFGFVLLLNSVWFPLSL